eukprot:CAMPEP_0179163340 /NCGR_PEP_ID=MMETSP0796-20121207/80081_1 /TAXON_ID=73915 /ORGANISM="Pyrodinium bahamense, Strain pbaha01" /LENGTH=164 /DNA_ID=CAMNT_0020865651 /DNA_START=1 /DNA_END=496 /DNA_ORIENTATION=+
MSNATEIRAKARHQMRRSVLLRDCAGRRAADGAPVQRRFGGAALAQIHGDIARHAGAQGRWASETGRAAATAGRLDGLSACSTEAGDGDETSSHGTSAGEDDGEASRRGGPSASGPGAGDGGEASSHGSPPWVGGGEANAAWDASSEERTGSTMELTQAASSAQ